MKKTLAVLFALSLLVLSGCSGFKTAPQNQVPFDTTQLLSRDQAIDLALEAAGLERTSVFDLEAELDRERSSLCWEVDFETREAEYSYDIHAYDGRVIRTEQEQND